MRWLLLLILLLTGPAYAAYSPDNMGTTDSNTTLRNIPTAAVKQITRLGYATPGDVEPLVFTASNSACSLNGGNGDGGSQVKSLDSKCWLARTTDPLQFGAKPGVYSFYGVTTTTSSGAVTLTGASFAAADVGSWITIIGAGPYEGRYIGQIQTVTDPTHITVSPNPTLAMAAFSTIVYYGPGSATAINAAMAAGTRLKVPVVLPAGIFMLDAPLQCTMVNYNNANLASPGCVGITGGGTILMAVADMAASVPDIGSVLTFGGNNSDYSQYIREANINGNGLTIDCNFRAKHGFNLPFSTEVNLTAFTVKNCLTSAFHMGSPGAPAASSGLHFHHNRIARDSFGIPISAMSCVGSKPLITTSIDHGIATGRVVAIQNANNVPGSVSGEGPIILLWDNGAPASGPRQGVLHGVDCSSWTGYTSGAQVYLTMPSSTIIHRVTNVTAASNAVVSISPGNLQAAGGQDWCFYGIGGDTTPYRVQKNAPDGCYTLSSVAGAGGDGPFQLTIPFNTTGFSFLGSGIAFRKPSLLSDIGLFEDNTTDIETFQNFISGVQYAFYGNPAGWDGKYTHNHTNNFTFHGPMIAAHYLGGHNTLVGEECDGVLVFCGQFRASGNTSLGSSYNGGNYSTQMDNAFWMWRLEDCSAQGYCATFNSTADFTASGDKYFGRSGTLRINELSNHALAGNAAWYASVPNYKSFGQQPGAFVLYPMPDSAVGTSKVASASGAIPNPAATASTSLVGMGIGTYCSITPMYKTAVEFTVTASLYNTLSGGAYGAIGVHDNSVPPTGNGVALPPGTFIVGSQSGFASTNAGQEHPITFTGFVQGLNLGTTYWIDVALRAFGSGTAGITNVTCAASEQ